MKLCQGNGAQKLTQERNSNEDCAYKVGNERRSATILRNHVRKAPSVHFAANDCLNIMRFVRCEIWMYQRHCDKKGLIEMLGLVQWTTRRTKRWQVQWHNQ
jgi:hypothetical protein